MKTQQTLASQPLIQDISAEKPFFKDIDLILVYYVLKKISDADHPLSVNEITNYLNQLFVKNIENPKEIFDSRTIRRKIYKLLDSEKNNKNEAAALLEIMMGGRIKITDPIGMLSGKSKTGFAKQKRFYFSPVLSDSDFDLISGTVQCSRYLSEEEKYYLLSRLNILSPKKQSDEKKDLAIADINSLYPLPKAQKNTLPTESSRFLRNAMILHYAIKAKKQVLIQYGTYNISDKMKITFCAKGDPFVLNPYAMFWSNGQYYLIATNASQTHPYHFRVDRIIQSAIHTVNDKNGLKSEVEREPVPDSLKHFFAQKNKSEMLFDSAKYTATYPNMRIFDENRLIDCTFECTSWSLQILIDTFGPENIKLSPSPIKHSDDELDLYGRPQTFLAATVRRVQYENAQKFCLSNPEYLTLLSPKELAKDVADRLSQYASRYQSYT